MHSHFDLQLIKLRVIPNLTSAGGQERDLTRSVRRLGRDQDVIGMSIATHALLIFLSALVMTQSPRRVPLSSAFGERVRDDTVTEDSIPFPGSATVLHSP